jgi:ketosteroid isomerase-like protein
MPAGNRQRLERILESVFASGPLGRDVLAEDDDTVVALGALRGHIRGPGMAVEAQHAQIWTFRDGRAIRMQWFNTHAEALQAAGVRE